jgi:cytochrome c553
VRRRPGKALTRPLGLAALALAGAAGSVHAGDIAAGQRKAQQQCVVCHGQNGISTAPDAPHLAGQPVFYLEAQLRAFRSGARPHAVMGVIAKGLSDADVADLSAWYASFRVQVEPQAPAPK